MDELHDRFHRLDRMATPNLWNEAVGRAAELEMAPRRGLNPAMVLIAASLLVAGLTGTIAVGAWLIQQDRDPITVTYENGVIAVVDACGAIRAIDPDTGIRTGLVGGECGEPGVHDVAWSSDGRWMAYLARVVPRSEDEMWPESSEVRLYDARSGSSSALLVCEGCNDVDISPDGSFVTFVEFTDAYPRGSLVLARTDGGALHRAPFVGSPGKPAFSPDGRTIAMPITGGTSGVHLLDVWGVNAGATPALRLLHGPVASDIVSWSPDGEWLAFDKLADGGVAQVWAMRRDGSDARLLEGGLEPIGPNPVWSADSSALAYLAPSQTDDGRWSMELWTTTLSGESTRLYRSDCCPLHHSGPAWSPDGEWIMFGIETTDRASAGLFLVRPDGSDLRRLSAFAEHPEWQPVVADP